MTQTELAGERCSKEYVSQIERGKSRPTADTVEWLAQRLGVSPAFLATGVSQDLRTRLEAALTRGEALIESHRFADAVELFAEMSAEVEIGRASCRERV